MRIVQEGDILYKLNKRRTIVAEQIRVYKT